MKKIHKSRKESLDHVLDHGFSDKDSNTDEANLFLAI